MSAPARFIPLASYREYPQAEMLERARAFNAEMQRHRTVREFPDRAVPREIIEGHGAGHERKPLEKIATFV